VLLGIPITDGNLAVEMALHGLVSVLIHILQVNLLTFHLLALCSLSDSADAPAEVSSRYQPHTGQVVLAGLYSVITERAGVMNWSLPTSFCTGVSFI
jgi:hypothetical protein